MKVLSVTLFVFLIAAISWMDFRLTGHVHAALLLPAALISFAFSFVKEKKTSLLVLSGLIFILSFARRHSEPPQVSAKHGPSVTASVFPAR